MIRKIVMKNLTCSNCIAKVERRTSRLPYVNSASFNFTNQILLVDFKDDYNPEKSLKEIKEIVDILEDNIQTYYYEDQIEVKEKINFWKDYRYVLLGGVIIFLTLFTNLIFYTINHLLHTTIYVPQIVKMILFWIGYLLLISKLLIIQIKGIKHFNIFNENTLMIIATLAAMLIGRYEESIAVVVLYSIGEHLQAKAVSKSKDEISSLVNMKVEYANVLQGDKIVIKDPMQIKIGDVLVIKNGERIPVDGEVVEGSTSLNTSELTGETKLKRVEVGNHILSGNINVGNVIHMKALKEYSDSTLAKILDLIENSTTNKSKPEMFITKFARVYTPIVVGLALLLVLYGIIVDPSDVLTDYGYVYRAAIFLVISCPCSMVLSVPLSYYAGIGSAAKQGILFKGSTYLHTLTDVETIALDKTGTLTYGSFFVQSFTDEYTLQLAASMEAYSNHPIAEAICNYNQKDLFPIEDVEEVPGYGITGKLNGEVILAGSRYLLEKYGIQVTDEKLPTGSYTFVSLGEKYIGFIIVKDELKQSSIETVREFAKKYDTVMLTGDNEESAHEIAKELGGIEYYAGLLPEQKLEKFNEIKTDSVSLFVGDGINDAPLLKQADIGVSLGSASDLAIGVSNIIIINSDIRLLDKAIRIAKKTRGIAVQNIVFSMVVKVLFLGLSTIGFMWMWLSLFADVGVALLCVLNALRIIYMKKFLSK